MSEIKSTKEQVLEGLKSIHEQSISDRSHYYVRSVTRQAIAYIEADSIPAEAGSIYDLKAEIQRLREENGRLREALEYYADNDKWFGPEQWDGKRWFTKVDLDDCSPVTSQDRMVGGKRARKALGRDSK